MDDDVFRKAQKYADEKHPLPQEMPGWAAAKAAMLTFLLLLFFDRLEHWLGFTIASVVATGTVTAIAFFDTQQRWTNHSKALRDAVNWFERDRQN